MDWLDLLAVQGTLKSLIQHHSSKASIFQCSAFFIVQLSHPYMTTRKIIALTRRTFVGHDVFSSAESCPTFCDPMDCSALDFPVPSPAPRAYSDSCLSSQWCHPTISSSVIPFSSLLQSFPTSGSFPVSQFFTSGGHSTGFSASASVLPMNIQDWFPLEWTGWISLQSRGLSRVFSNTTVQKHQFFGAQLSL